MQKQSIKTMVGIILAQFGAGIMQNWGVINLYIFSYFHFHPSPMHIDSTTNQKIMIMLLVPMTVFLFLSPKLNHWFGYEKVLRVSSIVYALSTLTILINFNFITLVVCCIMIPLTCFSASAVAMFYCLYSHFPDSKSKVTGMAIFSFGVGAIFWNLIATLTINPNNITPDVVVSEDKMTYFSEDIANRIVWPLSIIFIVCSVFYLVGVWLVTVYKPDSEEFQQQLGEEQVEPEPEQTGQIVAPPEETEETDSFCELVPYLKTKIFILLFLMSTFAGMYQFYVQFEAKIIYMPIVEDDHLISIGLMIMIAMGALFSIVWGFMGDKIGISKTLIIFVIVDFLTKLLSCFVANKAEFIASMVLLGATDKTMLILFAPALVDRFGLKIATRLLPFKGVSVLFTVVTPVLFRLILKNWSERQFLLFLCIFSLINVLLGIVTCWVLEKQRVPKAMENEEPMPKNSNLQRILQDENIS